MAATTRWVQYDVASTATIGVGGDTALGKGTRGRCKATASVGDSFDIGAGLNRLYMKIDGSPAGSDVYVTLASGTDLDPRFVAKDITEKIHNLDRNEVGYDQAQCVWENGQFVIYSGRLGSSSSVTVSSGTDTAHLELGFGTKDELGGSASSNVSTITISVSGTYGGFFDEIYRIVANKEVSIQTPSKGSSNGYPGTMTTGGVFNNASAITYTLYIDTTNGRTMGGGTGGVPQLSWVSTGSVDDGGPVELLYADFWYKVGTKGLMVKFTDDMFDNCVSPNEAWTIVCNAVQYVDGVNTAAPISAAGFVWGSSRGDDATAVSTTSSGFTPLGQRGVYVKFDGSSNITAGDEWYVICTPPQPQSYSISNLNYGNVTVSTESPVKAVMFEIMSGAVEISTVKFGLQSHGTFSHHNAGNNDTKFRFGTVGPGQVAGSSPFDEIEWRTSVTATDISSDIPPSYLYATKQNLSEVADADSSETIGVSTYAGMCADPIYMNIKLGTAEVGENSTINYRIYFDYS